MVYICQSVVYGNHGPILVLPQFHVSMDQGYIGVGPYKNQGHGVGEGSKHGNCKLPYHACYWKARTDVKIYGVLLQRYIVLYGKILHV